MPINREPLVYPGYVISQISRNAGERETMDYHVAQSAVASGTHRWHDEEADMPNHVQELINKRESDQAELDRANAEHNARLRAERDESEKEQAAQNTPPDDRAPIRIRKIGDDLYLARPFPATAIFDKAAIDAPNSPFTSEEDGDNNNVVVKLANAEATYRLKASDETSLLTELLSSTSPDVDIPEDWREKRALQLTNIAKKILGTTRPMTGLEAIAIIEEWTKVDDTVQTEADAGANQQPQPADPAKEAENNGERGNAADPNAFKNEQGQVVTPEERAQEAARRLAEGSDD